MLVGDVEDEGGREGGGEKERKWGRLCAWSHLEFRIIISHTKNGLLPPSWWQKHVTNL